MQTVTFKNFRAFCEEQQSARLAPLTLLVGENSTGKTSFMALIRALWDVAYADTVPNFREPPYDLGSWINIIHDHGFSGVNAGYFEASFEVSDEYRKSSDAHDDADMNVSIDVRFFEQGGAPYPTWRRFSNGRSWINEHEGESGDERIITYEIDGVAGPMPLTFISALNEKRLVPLGILPSVVDGMEGESSTRTRRITNLLRNFRRVGPHDEVREQRPYASAPIRSRPERTYDPGIPMRDPEGEHAASFLARVSKRGGNEWIGLKKQILGFGQKSGLFSDFEIRSLGDSEGDPFQIRVRPGTANDQTPFRNLADVGYGVSQILPVLTELLRGDGPRMFLLQQPEVHLHPSAQAALGSLFCSLAASGKQLIVETHSDHLIDRVRMSLRDKVTKLRPEDVSILYFDRQETDVKIHSISIDWNGNIMGAPENYRSFFMEEIERSIGLRKLNGAS